jgi:hypothetical protein
MKAAPAFFTGHRAETCVLTAPWQYFHTVE